MRSFVAFVLDKHKYSVKDTILVFSGTKNPFIGEIVKIEANPDDSQNTTLTLKWFYRPEEIHGGRRDYQRKYELLRSDHTDQIRVKSVRGPCKIVSFEDYQKLAPNPEEEEEEVISNPKKNVDLYRGLKEVGKWYK